MDFSEFQALAARTANYPKDIELLYLGLAINGEAGEIAEAIKKTYRDDGGQLTIERRVDLIKELGDVLWYLSAMCDALAVSLDYVAQANIVKLQDRERRGVLHGDGDNR